MADISMVVQTSKGTFDVNKWWEVVRRKHGPKKPTKTYTKWAYFGAEDYLKGIPNESVIWGLAWIGRPRKWMQFQGYFNGYTAASDLMEGCK